MKATRTALVGFAVGVGAVAACATRGPTPPEDPVAQAMRRKLTCAQDALEGLVRGDLRLVESSARRLVEISSGTAMMAHDTVTYHVHGDRFRTVAGRMAAHAAAGDLEAVTADYSEMSSACVACHSHLRQERFNKELPQPVSLAPPEALELVGPGRGR